jgi:hypothetical protein
VFIKADRHTQVAASPELIRQFEDLLGEESIYVGARTQPFLHEPPRRRGGGRR